MCRDQIIQQLLIETVHQIVERGRTRWLLGILEFGFAGYQHLSDAELQIAAHRFGLLNEASIAAHDTDEDEEDSDHSDNDVRHVFNQHFSGAPDALIGGWATDIEQ